MDQFKKLESLQSRRSCRKDSFEPSSFSHNGWSRQSAHSGYNGHKHHDRSYDTSNNSSYAPSNKSYDSHDSSSHYAPSKSYGNHHNHNHGKSHAVHHTRPQHKKCDDQRPIPCRKPSRKPSCKPKDNCKKLKCPIPGPCDKRCQTVCDKLCLVPPKDPHEEKHVTHCFKVKLGECKVTRNVKVTHCITANLDHHIKENVICKHAPCTKVTCEEINTVNDGKRCKAKFPREEDITFVDESDCCYNNSKSSSSCSDSSSSDSCSSSSSSDSCSSDSSSCSSSFTSTSCNSSGSSSSCSSSSSSSDSKPCHSHKHRHNRH